MEKYHATRLQDQLRRSLAEAISKHIDQPLDDETRAAVKATVIATIGGAIPAEDRGKVLFQVTKPPSGLPGLMLVPGNFYTYLLLIGNYVPASQLGAASAYLTPSGAHVWRVDYGYFYPGDPFRFRDRTYIMSPELITMLQ